jgi:GNAT superfamily N-acetyltransferase
LVEVTSPFDAFRASRCQINLNSNGRGNALSVEQLRDAIVVREVTSLTDEQINELSEILIGVVADGASVGYLPPLEPVDARTYWAAVIRLGNVLLIAERDGRIVGTAQLELALRKNGNHRAEVNKVLVRPDCQRQGIGKQLMDAVEIAARREERTLLHLDTREGDGSNILYTRAGYTEAGKIPDWARSADGTLHTTVFYYKRLV